MHVGFVVLSAALPRQHGLISRGAIVRPADAVLRSALVHGLCEEARKKSGIQPVTDFPLLTAPMLARKINILKIAESGKPL